jgi:hypothetical protein
VDECVDVLCLCSLQILFGTTTKLLKAKTWSSLKYFITGTNYFCAVHGHRAGYTIKYFGIHVPCPWGSGGTFLLVDKEIDSREK